MIEQFCEQALEDLSKHKNTNKEDLFLQYVNERLNKSFESYQEELQQSIEYLQRRNELNVIRKLNRMK